MLRFYRSLITLRRQVPDLSDPRLDQITIEQGDNHLLVRRGRHLIVANFGSAPVRVDAQDRFVLFATDLDLVVADGFLDLPGQAGVVLATKP